MGATVRTSSRLACCTVLAIGIAGSSAAQQVVRGSVLDSATETPIAGAVVTLTSANGASLGRTVTASSGEFSVSVSEAPVHARVLRIGFRPRDVDVAAAVAANAPIRVRMVRLPSLLDAVRVTGSELCPSSTDHGGAFTLWEQVHAGLLAAVVAREANPATATTLSYERREGPSDHLVETQTVSVRTGSTTRPFVAAASPQQFASAGYVTTDASSGGRTLFAPDADVLLDESFALTHCFHLQEADGAHRGQIGLAFAPVRQREGTVDVSGVIWVDAAQPALRSLDFRHTGFDAAWSRNPPGGHIEFHSAPNGVSFVERWFIDVPMLRVTSGAAGSVSPGRDASSQADHVTVVATWVSGGSVVSTRWRDGTSWSDAPTGISGVVTEKDTSHPVAGALVSIDGTRDTVSTDSLGRFDFTPMVPGRYLLRIADTTLRGVCTRSRGLARRRGGAQPRDRRPGPTAGDRRDDRAGVQERRLGVSLGARRPPRARRCNRRQRASPRLVASQPRRPGDRPEPRGPGRRARAVSCVRAAERRAGLFALDRRRGERRYDRDDRRWSSRSSGVGCVEAAAEDMRRRSDRSTGPPVHPSSRFNRRSASPHRRA